MSCRSNGINDVGADNRRFPNLPTPRRTMRGTSLAQPCLLPDKLRLSYRTQKPARYIDERRGGARSYFMVDIGGQWLRNIPGVSTEGDIRIPYAASFVWRGCFQWGIDSNNYAVERHGRSVVMLLVMKCSFGGVLIRETRFSSQKNGFTSGWADKKLLELSRLVAFGVGRSQMLSEGRLECV